MPRWKTRMFFSFINNQSESTVVLMTMKTTTNTGKIKKNK